MAGGCGGRRVVFIGEPGKGKTTSICQWLGLMRRDLGGIRGIDGTNLLRTSSGHTTAFEVRIRQTYGPSRIDVEPMSYLEQATAVLRLAENYLADRDDMEREEIRGVNAELNRVILNMAGLEDGEVIGMVSRKEFTDAGTLAGRIIGRMRLGRRRTTSITHDPSTGFEEWLSGTFSDINDGKAEGVAIPRSVTVSVSERDLDLGLDDDITEVIDTVGLDSDEIPDRLKELLRSPDTICILADDLPQCPSYRIAGLLRDAFRGQFAPLKDKVGILVKSPLENLVEVNECDGDSEKAKSLKRLEAEMKFSKERMQFDTGHMAFLDSCCGFTRENGVVTYDPDERMRFKRSLDRFIKKVGGPSS